MCMYVAAHTISITIKAYMAGKVHFEEFVGLCRNPCGWVQT